MIKLGLDVHGVIDTDPEFFSDLSKAMRRQGHEVYIITGREICDAFIEELNEYKMLYVPEKILSITTYQKEKGTLVSYLNGNKYQPIMASKIWNPTKAALCATAGIDIMIDDSLIYGKYFQDIKTQYIVYTPQMKEFLRTLFYFTS